jgi:hypothetical protein
LAGGGYDQEVADIAGIRVVGILDRGVSATPGKGVAGIRVVGILDRGVSGIPKKGVPGTLNCCDPFPLGGYVPGAE